MIRILLKRVMFGCFIYTLLFYVYAKLIGGLLK